MSEIEKSEKRYNRRTVVRKDMVKLKTDFKNNLI
jgi:hypothetical protein